jgi:hypothetical protein
MDANPMYDAPEPTGRVYITMESKVTGKTHLYVKAHKTDDQWIELDPTMDQADVFDRCWAFSKAGAKKIIEK